MDIIVDIDGTLADLTHRLHFLEKRDYDGFYGGMERDRPKSNVINTVNDLYEQSNRIVLCSGRPENYFTNTRDWLEVHGVPYNQLYMRPAGDYRKDHIIKAELYDQMIRDGYKPTLVIDDRPSVIAMWREKGLDVLQVVGWDEQGEKPEQGHLTILIGPSGAGKSSFIYAEEAQLNYGLHPAYVVSTDQIRHNLCGDFKDQSKNSQVFSSYHKVIKARLDAGLPAVADATNIKTADRIAVANLAHDKSKVRYMVFNRPMSEKVRTGGWRNEVKIGNKTLMEKHEETFNSNLKAILNGDGLGVEVVDMRSAA